MVEENILTVNKMLQILEEIAKNGGGNLKIKCGDSFLHDNEISLSPLSGELRLNGYLFNHSISKKVGRLKKDIEAATDSFYEDLKEGYK